MKRRIKAAVAGTALILTGSGISVALANASVGQCHVRYIDQEKGYVLPDPKCTPGATSGATKADLCVPGYTSTVRPPVSVTNRIKVERAKAYGIALDDTIELDHFIPLSLGGSNDISNLWPEPNKVGAKDFNNPKDVVEYRLYREMCDGKISLSEAQKEIKDWTNVAP